MEQEKFINFHDLEFAVKKILFDRIRLLPRGNKVNIHDLNINICAKKGKEQEATLVTEFLGHELATSIADLKIFLKKASLIMISLFN